MGLNIPCLPNIFLLNDDSTLSLNRHRKIILFGGFTAAKKMLIMRWKPPHVLNVQQWYCSFLDILSLELSIARSRNASRELIAPLFEVIVNMRALL